MIKDYEPITLGGFYQSEWELVCHILEHSAHEKAKAFKYKLQCKIDTAIRDRVWK